MTPLPLVDGALIIDNSFLEQLQECPRLLQYEQFQRIRPSGVRSGLNFGSAIHLAMEHRYKKYGSDLDALTTLECEGEQAELLSRFFVENPPPEECYRNLNWAMDIIGHYNVRYATEPFNLLEGADGKPMVELPFVVPFAAYDTHGSMYRINSLDGVLVPDHVPIIYAGKIDLPTLWDGHLFVLDHKTTSQLGSLHFDELRVSPQQIGYCWALWKTTGQRPIGFCVNSIRTNHIPAKPKTGIAAWWEESFQRNKEYLADHHYAEWERNTFALIEECLWHWHRDYFPMKRKWCVGKYGKCGMYDVCYAPPDQRGMLLESTAFEANTWSPLASPLKEKKV